MVLGDSFQRQEVCGNKANKTKDKANCGDHSEAVIHIQPQLNYHVQNIARPPPHDIEIGHPCTGDVNATRNLGVLFDSTYCFNDHVNKICQNINYQLYSICKIRKYLDKPTTERMINSAVTSHLDYCNSLLYGINGYLVSQLQRCQNDVARIVSLRRKYDRYWKIYTSCQLSTDLNTRSCCWPTRLNMAWLSSLLSPYKPGRSLRSEGKHLLTTPRYRLEGFGKRCFEHAAPSLWNTLPIPIKCAQSIDTFKSSLKTHLFNVAYS